ncbi:MAG: DNA cytosine methyltransferase [Desulfurococcaceae archaeon]|jgi:DNA (cytosine-5)-methyltransferase 1|nr:DNA cytosine methyltransferase [Desulfurococcaceae archaeon]MCC6052730.1 DNA cytosine methyltransferase [Desulfurococcaceae archaeon]
MSKYAFIDLFSGAGGFSLGFYLTGKFQPVLAVDNFKPATETYKVNFPETLVLVEDVRNLRESDLFKIAGPGEVDLIIGSPPCEPFTGANPSRERSPLDRLYVDPQGQLVLHFIRIVGYYKPRVFIMENVPAILEGGLREALMYEFRRLGYKQVYFNLLSAEDYGTPSRRRRVFISNIPIKPPRVEKTVTVGEALSDLPPPTAVIPNHDPPPELPYRKLRRAVRKKWGEALVYFHGSKKPIPNLIKLDPNDLAPTVMGSSRFIHPFENRLLTVREQARLMGFPDTFTFTGGRDSQYNMIGEAVPVPLATAIALYTQRVLDSGDVY